LACEDVTVHIAHLVIIESGLHIGLLFAALAAAFAFFEVGSRQSRGLVEPAGEDGARRKFAGFPGEDDEDGLSDLSGVAGIADGTQGGGIDEIHISVNEDGEGGLGTAMSEFLEQWMVVWFWHLPNDVRRLEKWT
jgi:hypothetical protein